MPLPNETVSVSSTSPSHDAIEPVQQSQKKKFNPLENPFTITFGNALFLAPWSGLSVSERLVSQIGKDELTKQGKMPEIGTRFLVTYPFFIRGANVLPNTYAYVGAEYLLGGKSLEASMLGAGFHAVGSTLLTNPLQQFRNHKEMEGLNKEFQTVNAHSYSEKWRASANFFSRGSFNMLKQETTFNVISSSIRTLVERNLGPDSGFTEFQKTSMGQALGNLGASIVSHPFNTVAERKRFQLSEYSSFKAISYLNPETWVVLFKGVVPRSMFATAGGFLGGAAVYFSRQLFGSEPEASAITAPSSVDVRELADQATQVSSREDIQNTQSSPPQAAVPSFRDLPYNQPVTMTYGDLIRVMQDAIHERDALERSAAGRKTGSEGPTPGH